MRIIAGLSKGRRLKAPKWPGLRPTSDKLRETLFNVVAARVPGARVLDVFAGTGAIGLESLSRGAEHVTFIENDKRAAALIGDNAELCGFQNRCVIIRDTAERVLQNRIPPWNARVLRRAFLAGYVAESGGVPEDLVRWETLALLRLAAVYALRPAWPDLSESLLDLVRRAPR